jgi:hypothetical protein
MVTVKYPKDVWLVSISVINERCPFIYYPADYVGCLVRKENHLDNDECQKENCPFRVN